MVYTQPNTFIKWLTLVMMSASLSLVFGGIFWDVPNSDPQLILNDRLGKFANKKTVKSYSFIFKDITMQ